MTILCHRCGHRAPGMACRYCGQAARKLDALTYPVLPAVVEQGRQAFFAGHTMDDNPYPSTSGTSAKRKNWFDGYIWAREIVKRLPVAMKGHEE